MPELAPGSWFNTASIRDYKQLFFDGLARLDARKTVAKIEDLSAGKDCALLCYEQPHKDDDWCHRGYISAWLKTELNLDVLEYGLEERGGGWSHPKIPAQYRLQASKIDPLDVSSYIGAEAPDGQGRVWKVIGFDPANVDQAQVQSGDDKRAISADVLKSRFQPII
ncbi:hypothetical protein [Mesorhizobium sp. M0058]|uniref:DUF488 family protein, N3 subclade n=1 Tax=Mesorhizobium sp. M0058 TaxID=2956865 RepID=UPI0033395D02